MIQLITLPEKLLSIQRKISKIKKSSTNPHFRSKYADLNEVLDVCKEALNEEGLVIAQSPGKDSFGQYVETSIINPGDAQVLSGKVYFSGAEDNMQKVGAAITYARRFGLISLLALESEDDDGETAVGRGQEAPRKVVQTEAKPPVAAKNPIPAQTKSSLTRDELNRTIRSTAKVAIDRKLTTMEKVKELIPTQTEDLTDDQANAVFATLKGLLK